MAIFKVTSLSKDKKSGNPQKLRTEFVDTSKHRLYEGINSKEEFRKQYERLQNMNPITNERVKILDIDRSNVMSRGDKWGTSVYKLSKVV